MKGAILSEEMKGEDHIFEGGTGRSVSVEVPQTSWPQGIAPTMDEVRTSLDAKKELRPKLDKIEAKKIYCLYHRLFNARTPMFSICLICGKKPFIVRSALVSRIALVAKFREKQQIGYLLVKPSSITFVQ